MQHTNHWDDGDTGAYFYFEEDAFTEVVGNADWDGKIFDIMQTGSQDWTGPVKVWKGTSSNGGAHGRRSIGEVPDQWEAEDIIVMGSCGRYT